MASIKRTHTLERARKLEITRAYLQRFALIVPYHLILLCKEMLSDNIELRQDRGPGAWVVMGWVWIGLESSSNMKQLLKIENVESRDFNTNGLDFDKIIHYFWPLIILVK